MSTSRDVEFHSDRVRELFSRSTESYGGHFDCGCTGRQFCFRRRLDIVAGLTRGRGGCLLDCATGTGDITAEVLRYGAFTHATMVDISDRMLARSHARIESLTEGRPTSLETVCSDVFKFLASKPRRRYDLILCLGLIAHTGRLIDLLESLKTCLAEGGQILLQTTLLDHWGTRIVRVLTRQRYFRRYGYQIAYFRARDVVQASRHAGLMVRETRRFAVGLPFADRIWPRANYRLERALQRWAAGHGAEAIYVISKPCRMGECES